MRLQGERHQPAMWNITLEEKICQIDKRGRAIYMNMYIRDYKNRVVEKGLFLNRLEAGKSLNLKGWMG